MAERSPRPGGGSGYRKAADDRRLQRTLRADADAEASGRLLYQLVAALRLHDIAREITLRVVLEHPPKGVDFALQKGRGSAYETTQKQKSDGKDLTFEFTRSVKD